MCNHADFRQFKARCHSAVAVFAQDTIAGFAHISIGDHSDVGNGRFDALADYSGQGSHLAGIRRPAITDIHAVKNNWLLHGAGQGYQLHPVIGDGDIVKFSHCLTPFLINRFDVPIFADVENPVRSSDGSG